MLPGQHHTRTGIPSRVTAIPTITCGRSSQASLDLPYVRNPAWAAAPSGAAPSGGASSRPGRAAIGPVDGRLFFPVFFPVILPVEDTAAVVTPDRRIGLLGLEVGAGGVEEDQVDVVVQQVRVGVEHPARDRVLDPDQPVHRPLTGELQPRHPVRPDRTRAIRAGVPQLTGDLVLIRSRLC